MAAPTFDDFFNAAVAEAQSRRPELTFDEGDISEFYAVATAAMADHVTGWAASRIKATFLDGAQDDDLTTLADDHWNIQRLSDVAATGVLTFTRPTFGAGAGVIPAGTAVSTSPDPSGTRAQFTTDFDLNFGATDLTLTATATAVNTGPGGNVDVGKINKIIPSLFDSTFTVTNAARFAGGADEEDDDSLRERVRLFPTTIRRGTLAALEYGARTVAGVANATAVEELDPNTGKQIGVVDVYITDGSGGSSGPLVSAVQAEIENWRAAGVLVQVTGGSLVTQNVTVSIVVRPGVDATASGLIAQIQAAVIARIAQLKIGDTLQRDFIRQAVLNVSPNIVGVTVSVPVGDVAPSPNQIIRAGTVTVA